MLIITSIALRIIKGFKGAILFVSILLAKLEVAFVAITTLKLLEKSLYIKVALR